MKNIELPEKGNVVIIGYAATGKTTLADSLKFDGKLYHTDDYIPYGFEQALYVLIDDLKKDSTPLKVIEGILGYRLLRKGLQLQNFFADLIIVCEASKEVRYDRIKARHKDAQATFNLDKVCDKFWSDYTNLKSYDNSFQYPKVITIKS